jgi:hypothetical protein
MLESINFKGGRVKSFLKISLQIRENLERSRKPLNATYFQKSWGEDAL